MSDDNAEENNLALHVKLCELRYQQLNSHLNQVNDSVARLSLSIDSLHSTINTHTEAINAKILKAAWGAIGLLCTCIGTLIIHFIL